MGGEKRIFFSGRTIVCDTLNDGYMTKTHWSKPIEIYGEKSEP